VIVLGIREGVVATAETLETHFLKNSNILLGFLALKLLFS